MDQIVQMITVFAPLSAGIWVAYTYIDSRNRQISEERSQRYARTICEISRICPDGRATFLVENIAAIYRLIEFREKAAVSIIVLEVSMTQAQWAEMLGPHAKNVLGELRRMKPH